MSFWKVLLASILGFFISVILIGAFFFTMIFALIASSSDDRQVAVSRNSILEIEPEGTIAEYLPVIPLEQITKDREPQTMREYLSKIESAGKDERISGIFLRLGRYGGSWSQAGELRSALLDFKNSGKFIYAASGPGGYDEINYYLATVADSILINPAAGMEMNGIAASISYYRPMLERLGIRAEVLRAGSFKSAVEPFILDSASNESRTMMMQIVDGLFAPFRESVEKERKIAPAQLDSIMLNNALMTATEARDHGLVDAVLYDDQVTKLLAARTGAKEKPKLVELEDYFRSGVVDDGAEASDAQIAIVYATGQINRGKSDFTPNPLFGGESIGSETFAEAMRTARERDDIKAVVLRIDSPGGDAAASEEMWREVVLTKEKKPVVVSMGNLAASGGYFIAAPADTIVAAPTSITGSIGVFGLWFTAEKFLEEKIGVNTSVFKSAPNADMFSPARTPTDLERQILGRQVDSTYRQFLQVVASGRKLSIDSVDRIAQGRVWTGTQAKELGLVDVLGGFDTAVDIAARMAGLKEGGYRISILPRQRDFFEVLFSDLEGSMGALFSTRTPLDEYRAMIEAAQTYSGIQARMTDISVR